MTVGESSKVQSFFGEDQWRERKERFVCFNDFSRGSQVINRREKGKFSSNFSSRMPRSRHYFFLPPIRLVNVKSHGIIRLLFLSSRVPQTPTDHHHFSPAPEPISSKQMSIERNNSDRHHYQMMLISIRFPLIIALIHLDSWQFDHSSIIEVMIDRRIHASSLLSRRLWKENDQTIGHASVVLPYISSHLRATRDLHCICVTRHWALRT